MKNYRILAIAAVALIAASCNQTARISGVVKDAPQSDVIVKMLNVNVYNVLDTVKTDKSGAFSYKVAVAEGQPEFVYLFHGDTKIASLLLQKGDNVKVSADTLGNYTVEGSEESLKLQEVEKNFADFVSEFARISAPLDNSELTEEQGKEINKALSKAYIDYYRKALTYVVKNNHSLTCVPVLFQSVNEGFPIFSQNTDAIHFRNVCDTLKTVYPDSKYVKALEKEALAREQVLGINARIMAADEIGYPNLNLPDVNGNKVAMTSLDSKVILVHFWSAADATHKMFNLDVLEPLYKEFHGKGLEIYSVAVDTDKALWASSVKSQKLPWINVCDGLGNMSPALSLYNVAAIPTSFIISDGHLTGDIITSEDGLRKAVQSLLK